MNKQTLIQRISTLTGQLKDLGSSLSVSDRAEAQTYLLSALRHVESPYEYLFRLSGSHLQLALIRVASDTGLFRALVNSDSPLSCNVLSDKTGIAPELLGRILRHLTSVGTIRQLEADQFLASDVTRSLVSPGMESGTHLLFDIHNRTYQALPDHLASNGYKDVTDIRKGVFQDAFATRLSCYEYLAQTPTLQGYMQEAMNLHESHGDWLSALNLDREIEQWTMSGPSRILFVDIGGGLGHQCMLLRRRHPGIVGRVILQDIPITIERLPKPMPLDIEAMPHNFDEPQPIMNAKFYYVRNVLHGLPDGDCVAALQNIAASMNTESLLVVDDIVIPESGSWTQACQLDFIMMASIAGKKRTLQQWKSLLNAAGFLAIDFRPYSEPMQDSLIIASLAPL